VRKEEAVAALNPAAAFPLILSLRHSRLGRTGRYSVNDQAALLPLLALSWRFWDRWREVGLWPNSDICARRGGGKKCDARTFRVTRLSATVGACCRLS